ncbi:MAG: hypothetical protein ACPLXO_04455, partial [Desulfurella sp.]
MKTLKTLKTALVGFLLVFIMGYRAFAVTQGFTTYSMSIVEIEGLQHGFSVIVTKYINNQQVANYDVTQSVMPIYSSPIGSKYGTQFANNNDLINTANTVFPQDNFYKLVANAGSMIQKYGVSNVSVTCVYSANVYDPVTQKYVNKWAINSAMWNPNVENLTGSNSTNTQTKSTGWVVTNPNPYVAVVTYFT